jgi:hypothetical protein
LDAAPSEDFARIIALAQAVLAEVVFTIDQTPQRAILRLEGKYGPYQVLITELVSEAGRKYSYYVLSGSRVEAGFDNTPDPRAIRLKYGHIGSDHSGETVPHLHLEDKTRLELTDEVTFEEFLAWVRSHIKIVSG